MTADQDDLAAWISELRGRVARGDLDGRGEFETGGGRFAIGLAARILLADLDHQDRFLAGGGADVFVTARRRDLLADLRRLREQLG